jgi:hypothetical protein
MIHNLKNLFGDGSDLGINFRIVWTTFAYLFHAGFLLLEKIL